VADGEMKMEDLIHFLSTVATLKRIWYLELFIWPNRITPVSLANAKIRFQSVSVLNIMVRTSEWLDQLALIQLPSLSQLRISMMEGVNHQYSLSLQALFESHGANLRTLHLFSASSTPAKINLSVACPNLERLKCNPNSLQPDVTPHPFLRHIRFDDARSVHWAGGLQLWSDWIRQSDVKSCPALMIEIPETWDSVLRLARVSEIVAGMLTLVECSDPSRVRWFDSAGRPFPDNMSR